MEEKTSSCVEIRRLGSSETFKGIGVVQKLTQRSDKNGRPFWEITLSDSTGSFDGKIWGDAAWWDLSEGGKTAVDPSSENLPRTLRGKSLGVQGKMVEFRGQPQVNVTALYLLDQEKYPPSLYVQAAPVPLEDLEKSFWEFVLESGRFRPFLEQVFSGEFWERFRHSPAAVTHHHAYAHGLLEHTVSVTRLALALGKAAGATPHAAVDTEVVVAGALLHDLGKVESYSLSPVPEMTLPGAVLDHVGPGFARFLRFAETWGLDERSTLAIGHILLSHHGQKEYGAAVLPATPEAMIVSSADELDFRLFCWGDATGSLPEGEEISDFHFSAQRRFWKWQE
ncbi:MAG: 3'-5' exoribonuclease YhaM family protein [Synergistales bacterium]|jgi:3'-5' exoribonuclease